MNRRKYISSLLGSGSIGLLLYKYPVKKASAELTGFHINNIDKNNVVSLKSSSNEINGINLRFDNFEIDTQNISQLDKDMKIKFYAKIENNNYSTDVETITVPLSDNSESLTDITNSITISNADLDGELPTVNEDSKNLYLKIEIKHDDLKEKEIFEKNFKLDIGKQDIIAEGGNEIYDIELNDTIYRVHAYTEAGNHTFNVTNDSGEIDILVIGGGGAGGLTYGSGGGAGGLVFKNNMTISEEEIPVVVGKEGISGKQSEDSNDNYTPGEPGENSKFGNIEAFGGGGGATDGTYQEGDGGSGGGGGANDALQPSSSSGGLGNKGYTVSKASGGGGAGEEAIDATGGNGVNEIIIDNTTYNFANLFGLKYGEIIDGQSWFAGGGVAQHYAPNSGIDGGGKGGGGSGEENPSDRPELDRIGRKGILNTGGGGGGANTGTSDAGNGGTGIVLIRYSIDKNESDINPSIVTDDFERNIALRDWKGNKNNWELERNDSLNKHQSISTTSSNVDESIIYLDDSVTGRLPKRGDKFSILLNAEDITDQSLIGFGMNSSDYNPNSGTGYSINIGEGSELQIYKDGISQNSITLDTTQYNTTIEIEINWSNDGEISVRTFEFDTATHKRSDEINNLSITDSEYDEGVVSLTTGGNNSKRIFDRLWIINN